MHSKTAKMAVYGRYTGGCKKDSKKDSKKDVSRYTRRVEAKKAIAESRAA